MKAIEYHLNIYAPDSRTVVMVGWRSSSPFMHIGQDDVINCSGFEKNSTRMLRVARIEHLIWESPGNIAHKVLVFTSLSDVAAVPAPSPVSAVVAVPMQESGASKGFKKK